MRRRESPASTVRPRPTRVAWLRKGTKSKTMDCAMPFDGARGGGVARVGFKAVGEVVQVPLPPARELKYAYALRPILFFTFR